MPRKPVAKPKAKPAPTVVPALIPCPGCGVELEAGKGTHGLAWHGCRAGPSSVDLVEQEILQQMRVVARESGPKDLVLLLDAMRAYRKSDAPHATPDEVQDWLTRRE